MIPDAPATDFVYDVECFPNVFVCTTNQVKTGERWIHEISVFRNQSVQFVGFLHALRDFRGRMIGFNNIAFDYILLHYILDCFNVQGYVAPEQIFNRMQEIFRAQEFNRFGLSIWESEHFVQQLDLFKIHHFDNPAKRTSLKALEFNMRSASVEDMPVAAGTILTDEQVPILTSYNGHDVDETERFLGHSYPMIRLREELSASTGINMLNFNDTKIGKQFFIAELEKRVPGICYRRTSEGKKPNQTWRSTVPLGPLILPLITFRDPELNRVLGYLRMVELVDTNKPPELKDLKATLRGTWEIYFGAGGGHASLSKATIRADANHEILDVDVKSYYPNIAIKNRIYPEHLTEIFCDIYLELYNQRAGLPKKSGKSAMLKLALNGVFGDSNNDFGPFKDPAYTMAITVNGQLMLAMLAEWLVAHPGIQPIQLNTDGVTVKVHRDARAYFDQACLAWQFATALELEIVNYREMHIRDVNNYLAVGIDGKIKRKGDYQHDTSDPNNIAVSRGWSQDWSALVVPKAAEAALVEGLDVADFVNRHADPFDFMIKERSTGKNRLALHFPAPGQAILKPLSQTVRYHIAKPPAPTLVKIMPPLDRKVRDDPNSPDRHIRVNVGWSVNVCNRAEQFSWAALDRRWYIEETQKLIGMTEQ